MITITIKRNPSSVLLRESESKDNYIISFQVEGKQVAGGMTNSVTGAKFMIKSMLEKETNYIISDEELNFIIDVVCNLINCVNHLNFQSNKLIIFI